MYKLLILSAFVSLAIAKPGYLESAPVPVSQEIYADAPYPAFQGFQGAYSVPFGFTKEVIAPGPIALPAPIAAAAPIAIAKQVVAVPEPQDVSYTRTDVISRKVTASAPNAAYISGGVLDNAVPHAVKNIHYAEENIQSGPHGSRQNEAENDVEVGLRNIHIDIPQAQGVEVRSKQISAGPDPQMPPGPPEPKTLPGPPEPAAQPRSQPPPQPQPQPQPAPQFRQFEAIETLPPAPQYIPAPVERPAPQLRTVPAPAPVREEPIAQLRSSFIAPVPAPRITEVNRAYIGPAIARVQAPSITYAEAPARIALPAHIAYSAPVASVDRSFFAPAPIAYSAPVAPVAKSFFAAAPVAYSAPVAQVAPVSKAFFAPAPATFAAAIPGPLPAHFSAHAAGPAVLEKTVSFETPAHTKILHGPGAISTYY